ncbi:hypothetical protein AS026_35465 [Rhizobium altiplani]|uniref:Uncharacterized protein n=1 Tax=Rhizobium altiplani TaxID=1864509 RepID=A0A109JW91_9HYPH|nr:hypothetical protein AS026_35465 [Rhizobium altiplani]
MPRQAALLVEPNSGDDQINMSRRLMVQVKAEIAGERAAEETLLWRGVQSTADNFSRPTEPFCD